MDRPPRDIFRWLKKYRRLFLETRGLCWTGQGRFLGERTCHYAIYVSDGFEDQCFGVMNQRHGLIVR